MIWAGFTATVAESNINSSVCEVACPPAKAWSKVAPATRQTQQHIYNICYTTMTAIEWLKRKFEGVAIAKIAKIQTLT